jgi:Zn-dependent oligopeptidase
MWSEVYSADMFATVFKNANKLLDPAAGMSYRKKVLAKGGSRDAMDSLVDFLGRKPSSEVRCAALRCSLRFTTHSLT